MRNKHRNRFLTLCFTLLCVSGALHTNIQQHLDCSVNKLVSNSSPLFVPRRSVPTYQRPLSGADPHAVSGAGREFGPVGQLAVILAGELTSLSDGGHGLGEFQTLVDVGLRPVQLAAGHGWKDQKKTGEKGVIRTCRGHRVGLFFYCSDGLIGRILLFGTKHWC